MISGRRLAFFGSEVYKALRSDFRGRNTSRLSKSQQKEIVVLLHGIGKSSLDMAPMAAALRHEGFLTINWKYPSRRYPVEKLADLLAELLKELDADRTHFIAHSMGGIIVRNYLSRYKPQNAGRFVMIGTPNQGAYLADKLSAFRLFQYVFGPAGTQLCSGNRGACACAGVPACEFGIIAGGLGWKYGWNPLVPGDNDGTVSVECTRLEGASDFIVVRHAHPVIQMMPKTIKLAISFLRTGKFCN